MAEDWIDIDLMVHVAKHFSNGSMVLLGKVTTDISRLTSLPNVHLLGRKPFETLPAYCKAFDVAMNPFPINEVTLNANPLKVREYLAAGLPGGLHPHPRGGGDEAGAHRRHEGGVRRGHRGGAARARARTRRGARRCATRAWEGRVEEMRRHMAAIGRG